MSNIKCKLTIGFSIFLLVIETYLNYISKTLAVGFFSFYGSQDHGPIIPIILNLSSCFLYLSLAFTFSSFLKWDFQIEKFFLATTLSKVPYLFLSLSFFLNLNNFINLAITLVLTFFALSSLFSLSNYALPQGITRQKRYAFIFTIFFIEEVISHLLVAIFR